ncbi:MAG: hypothetical protein ACXWB2_16835 [Acidimicrobiales bacterium]
MNFVRRGAIAATLLGTTAAGGAVGATMLTTPASAQTSTTTAPATAPADPATGTAPSGQAAPAGPHQANGKTETLLTGDDLAKVTAAVEAKEPGATIERAETDADGAVYEAHITTSDGSRATVKLDDSFNVTSVDTGMS